MVGALPGTMQGAGVHKFSGLLISVFRSALFRTFRTEPVRSGRILPLQYGSGPERSADYTFEMEHVRSGQSRKLKSGERTVTDKSEAQSTESTERLKNLKTT